MIRSPLMLVTLALTLSTSALAQSSPSVAETSVAQAVLALSYTGPERSDY